MLVLKKRESFLAVARGQRLSRRGFVLQALERKPDDSNSSRTGFTVTKKTGNAVERNRIKRRLREIVRLHGPDHMKAGWDYVLIGRRGALSLPFDAMIRDFAGALGDAHKGKSDPPRPRRQSDRRPKGQKSR